MPQLVSELQQRLSTIQERAIETTLGQIRVDEEAHNIYLDETGDSFPLDEKVERSFAKYLGVPKAYLDKCDPAFKAVTVNHWLQKRANGAAVVETINGTFVNVHKPGLVIIPLSRVIDVISNTLDPTYEITNLIHNDTRFQVDIITPHKTIEVPTWDEIEDRNPLHHATVGDITHGGIRFVSNPTEVEDPKVMTYLHRRWCTNGATSPVADGTIRLKGRTVDEVLLEMETAMNRAVSGLDEKLEQFAALATQYPPGSKEAFARQLGLEHKIPARVLNKILDRIEILPDGASLFDIMQVFTSMANEENMKYETALKLQELGGTLAFQTAEVTHRCGTCERLLP